MPVEGRVGVTGRRDFRHECARAVTSALGKRHSDRVETMLAERDILTGADRWRWSLDLLRASLMLRLSERLYPLAIAAAVTLRALYQWSADDRLLLIGGLGVLTLGLGLIAPALLHAAFGGFARRRFLSFFFEAF